MYNFNYDYPTIPELSKLYDKSEDFIRDSMKAHGIKFLENKTIFLPLLQSPTESVELRAFRSDLSSFYNLEPSLTKQEFTEDSDPNVVLERYSRGLDVERVSNPYYADMIDIPDSYHSALNFAKKAESTFMSLNADIRKKFDNNVGKFLDFCNDESNFPEMIKLGLAKELSTPTGSSNSQGGAGELGNKTDTSPSTT